MATFGIQPTRRAVLTGVLSIAASSAIAKAPLSNAQVAGVHRFKIGTAEIVAILDGYFDLNTELMPKASTETVQEIQRAHFMPTGKTVRSAINTYIVNTGNNLTLIDTGARDYLGPTVGKFPANLAAAGYSPEQVDRIILTHMHPDHIGGVIDTSGARVFPNATMHANEGDWSFWRDPQMKAKADAVNASFFDIAKSSSDAYEDRAELYKFGRDLGDGITALDMSGHTPGHSGLVIESNGSSLFILGDVVHSAPLQFTHPEWGIAFDVDQEAAIKARMRSLDMAATDRVMIAGMHIPFPGIGYVEKRGKGYQFIPAPWQYVIE